MDSAKKKTKTRKTGKKVGFVLLTILLIGMTTMAICGMAFAVYINKYVSDDVDIYLDSYRLNLTSFIYYVDSETGEEVELDKLHGTEDRVWVDLEEIPKQLQNAFISVEDNTFYSHHGVNWKRTLGAGLNYLVHFRANYGGGSTITQQLIKNLTGEDETSVKRKLQEVMRALELEKKYSKEDILEMYLNTIYFGEGAYGVKQAAQTYFRKDLDQLTLAECASIAGMTKNPYGYDLLKFPEENTKRRAVVLDCMKDYGKITQDEYDQAIKAEVAAYKDTGEDDGDTGATYQSYFVDAVINAVIEDLQSEKGYSKNTARQLLYSGGLKIVSTIDPTVQSAMDAVFTDEENFPGGLGNDGTYPQASMAIMDPYTGHVLALYGGRGEKEGNLVLNRATQTYRSPGSAIKPITVYSPALEYGEVTPISVVDDAPKDFTTRKTGWPYNESRTYSGRTTILNGIAKSLNTVAVDLIQKVGTERSYNWATKNLGLTSLVDRMTKTLSDGTVKTYSDIDVSPLAMGSLTKGVTVLEMTAAYSSFVNDGQYTTPALYTKVYNSDGTVLLDNQPVTTVAMSTKTRDYMIELLTNAVKNGTGRKAAISGIEVGGKTGTTSADNDRWFAGITPYYVGVVWFGFDTPQSLQKFSTNPALSLWTRVMKQALTNKPNASFEYDTDLVKVNYCLDCGKLSTDLCSNDIRGSRVGTAYIAQEDMPTETCDCHVSVSIDKGTKMIATAGCPQDQLRTVSVLNFKRAYPSTGIAIADQIYCAPYDLTAEQVAQGYSKPSTPTMQTCTQHLNVVPEVPETPEEDGEITPETPPTQPETPEEGTGNNGGTTTEPPTTQPGTGEGGGTTTPDSPAGIILNRLQQLFQINCTMPVCDWLQKVTN